MSRVLQAPSDLSCFDTFIQEPDVQEISRYLNVIQGHPNDPHGAFINDTCGFHVHVARLARNGSDDVMLSLPILQHLAYLLVQYEEIISSLHPPERRAVVLGDSPASKFVASNLMGLRRSAHLCQQHARIDLETTQRKIFATDMTPERLAKLMDTSIFPTCGPEDVKAETILKPEFPMTNSPTRYKFVNFERIHDVRIGAGAITIEFRQHRGILDFNEIAHWIHFVLSLVKAAERKAISNVPISPGISCDPLDDKQPTEAKQKVTFQTKQGDKHKPRSGQLGDQVQGLFCNVLELDIETQRYWLGKWKEYNPEDTLTVEDDWAGIERIVIEEENCPPCRRELTRKAEARGRMLARRALEGQIR